MFGPESIRSTINTFAHKKWKDVLEKSAIDNCITAQRDVHILQAKLITTVALSIILIITGAICLTLGSRLGPIYFKAIGGAALSLGPMIGIIGIIYVKRHYQIPQMQLFRAESALERELKSAISKGCNLIEQNEYVGYKTDSLQLYHNSHWLMPQEVDQVLQQHLANFTFTDAAVFLEPSN